MTLDIVVEALGRVNFGCVWDFKGLTNPNVRLNGVQPLPAWRYGSYHSLLGVNSFGGLVTRQTVCPTLLILD